MQEYKGGEANTNLLDFTMENCNRFQWKIGIYFYRMKKIVGGDSTYM
jgi:hypothetical protein